MSTQGNPFEHQSPQARGSQPRQHPLSPLSRKQRSDAGSTLFTARDEFALAWIGEQYAIRLDHLQQLLRRLAGRGAAQEGWISESATRDVLRRWQQAGWASATIVRKGMPPWVWPTRLGLHKACLPYAYRDMGKANTEELEHLSPINEVRLHLEEAEEEEGVRWISERQLLQGVQRIKGKTLLHRPDGELHYQDGTVTAVEMERTRKHWPELAEILVELLRGEEYVRLKAERGWKSAREMSQHAQSQYRMIYYFAPPDVRQYLWRARARLVREGGVSAEEARCLSIFRYPPARSEEEIDQDEQEDEQARQSFMP